MTMNYRPTVLVVLDGFGYSVEKKDNAIAQANTPFLHRIEKECAHTRIAASGEAVGLPAGQMGNSEVGHLNIGAGRIIRQDVTRIDADIASGDFYQNPALVAAVDHAIASGKAIHVMGLLSPGGVHSHELHIFAMLQLAAKRGAKKVYVHAFLDGRDMPPKSALPSLQALTNKMQEFQCGRIASIIGRYYAMDRDNRWDRVQCAYDLLTQGKAERVASTAEEGLAMAYAAGENDEFVKATSIHANTEAPVVIQDGDSVIFMNYRADRAREITNALMDKQFTGFVRAVVPAIGKYTTLTQYDAAYPFAVAYAPATHTNVLGEVIAKHGLHQLRIAETEKYAHVTFFFNGGVETPFPGEDRELIPSPKVATYDMQPEMSASTLTEKLTAAILSKKYDLIVCNYANPDMVGHTGDLAATISAIETIDACLSAVNEALQHVGGELMITADHGNAEKMFDEATGQAHTAHTSNPVPFIFVGRSAKITHTNGALYDVAPTVLYVMGIEKPKEMLGCSLLEFVA